MNEQVTSAQPTDPSPGLNLAVTVLPPLSLAAALLVYFAWDRRIAYASALGFDPGLLGNTAMTDYLLRSVSAVFFPLLVALTGTLVWLGIDRSLRRRAQHCAQQAIIFRVSWAVIIGGAAVLGGTIILGMCVPAAVPYVAVLWPFLATLTILTAAYGASLRRLVSRNTGIEDGVSRRWAINIVVGLLVAALLFDGMDGFALVVGRGLALQVIQYPDQHTKSVQLYSAQDLQLDKADATKQQLPSAPDAAYHYRYDGLRLITYDGDNYFLIGRTWRPSEGKVIVLHQDNGIRIEFPRGTQRDR